MVFKFPNMYGEVGLIVLFGADESVADPSNVIAIVAAVVVALPSAKREGTGSG